VKQNTKYTLLLLLAALFFIVVAAVRNYVVDIAELSNSVTQSNSILFIILVNFNIIAVMFLIFLVIKNIVKLFLDRKNKILGSQLRTRLVVAFIGLSLVPTILLFSVSSKIVTSAFNIWFSPQVTQTVDGALGVARLYFSQLESNLYSQSLNLARDVSEYTTYANKTNSPELLEAYLKRKVEDYSLTELAIVNASGQTVLRVTANKDTAENRTVTRPNLFSVSSALKGEPSVKIEQSLNGEFIRGYAQIVAPNLNKTLATTSKSHFQPFSSSNNDSKKLSQQTDNLIDGSQSDPVFCLVATKWIDRELTQLLTKVVESYEDFTEQSMYRGPLYSSYVLTLVIVTLIIIFAAIWVGFYLSKTLVTPIQTVAAGTVEIAKGNLDYRIPEMGDDELSILVTSFNKMTADLKHTTTELVDAEKRAAWQEVAKRFAHEIKNPLTPIQLSAQRIQRRADLISDEKTKNIMLECADTIIGQVSTLKILVQEFSRFARLPKNRPIPLDLHEVLLDVYSTFSSTNQDISFELDLEEEMPILSIDKVQMKQAFMNIFDNAVTAIHARFKNELEDGKPTKGGVVETRTRYDKFLGLVTVFISDDGVGIPEESKPKLFQPYFSTKKGGTGLGLAIVSSIIADHKGHIKVKDNSPTGTVFIIELDAK